MSDAGSDYSFSTPRRRANWRANRLHDTYEMVRNRYGLSRAEVMDATSRYPMLHRDAGDLTDWQTRADYRFGLMQDLNRSVDCWLGDRGRRADVEDGRRWNMGPTEDSWRRYDVYRSGRGYPRWRW